MMGLLLSILLGPSFFLLIETSIQKGVRAALSFDAGVFTSDLFYIMLAYLFYHEVSTLLSGSHVFILKIIGGAIFVLFALYSLRKKSVATPGTGVHTFNVTDNKEYFKLFLKGFLWNFANPGIVIYWLTIISVGVHKVEGTTYIDPIIIYLISILVTFFSIDIFKIFAAKRLRPFITPALLNNLSRFISFLLIGFGIVFFIQGVVHFLKL